MKLDAAVFLAEAGVLAPDAPVRVRPLAGGYWNDVLRVTSHGDDLVVKHFGPARGEASLFPIVPEDEARALVAIAGHDVGPEAVGFWPADDAAGRGAVLVYRFLEGEPWDGDPAEAAQLLRRIHELPIDGFRRLAITPEEVLEHADSLPDPPAGDPAWRRLAAARPEPQPVPPLARRRFLHGDIGTGNMIATPRGARCIDWQCPGLGDPAEDLWTFLSPTFQVLYGRAPWTPAQVARFRDAYGDAATLERYDAMAPFFCFRMARYAAHRVDRLAGRDPEGAARYARGLAAETAWLEGRRRAGEPGDVQPSASS